MAECIVLAKCVYQVKLPFSKTFKRFTVKKSKIALFVWKSLRAHPTLQNEGTHKHYHFYFLSKIFPCLVVVVSTKNAARLIE